MRPTRVAPLAIFLREDAARLLPAASGTCAAVASGERCAGGARKARSFVFQRSGAGHRSAGERSGRRTVGTGRRRARHRRRIRESAGADRSEAAARRGARHGCRVRGMRPDGGRCSKRAQRRTEPGVLRANSFWTAGAWCSAICWRARRWRRRGASCWWCCGGWKRAARFAADASSPDSSASSSRGPKRSICCATSAGRLPADEEIEIALADPLNLTGVVLPGPADQRARAGFADACATESRGLRQLGQRRTYKPIGR